MRTIHTIIKPITSSQDLNAAELNYVTTRTKKFKLEEVTLKASQAITETITITRDSLSGSNYDSVLASRDMQAETDFVFRPQGECNFWDGDNCRVQCTQANGVGTVYIEIKISEM